jgi:hypothetical protein
MKLKARVLIHSGTATSLYDDKVSGKLLEALGGRAQIKRASHVEAPLEHLEKIEFVVDLKPSGGPVLKGFGSYQEAVQAEVDWINENVLTPAKQTAIQPTPSA